jgi:HSP20 family molecular chaperone IbpA
MTEQAVTQNGSTKTRAWASPAVDVLEGKDEYLVYADVPGVKKDGLTVQYHDGELRVEASRALGEDLGWPSDFRRTFAIGPDVDVERISARIENGVLEVHLPKKEAAKPRQISVA